MSLLDPAARSAKGAELQAELTGMPAPDPATPLEASWRDFIYAEIWSRPQLDHRARFLISLASAAGAADPVSVERYARGALLANELTLAELREAALHTAVYGGWSCGTLLDAAVTRAATALNLSEIAYAPILAQPWDMQARREAGTENFKSVMCFGGPPPKTAFFEVGILNFVFGEIWTRPGLDERARRWLTLVGVSNSSSSVPIRSHVWAAMASGNATADEMFEFVLQYAVHGGWPKASVIQTAVLEQAERVSKGLPFEA